MAIRRTIEHLPPAEQTAPKLPSRNPFILRPLVESWWKRYQDSGKDTLALALPEAGPYRASWAGTRCDRALYYKLAGVETTEKFTVADQWRMDAGSMVHEQLGAVYAVMPGDWRMEEAIDLRTIGIPGSSHGDVVEWVDGQARTVVELKTINGFGFKSAASNFKGGAQGPRWGHVIQALLSAAALGADRIVIAYVSLELISPDIAARTTVNGTSDDELLREMGRFAAEWHLTVEDLRPVLDHEVARIQRIVAFTETELLPARELHDPEYADGAVVFNPNTGAWTATSPDTGTITATGTTWACRYCAHRTRCIEDGKGTPVTMRQDVGV